MRLGNGRWETAHYNSRQQITRVGLGTGSNTQNLLKLELDYGDNTENNGNLLEQKITVPTVGVTAGFTATQEYSYDALNRLLVAEEKILSSTTWKQTFTMDRYGNRRYDAGNTTTLGGCSEEVCNPTISTSTNRFTSSGWDYDEVGNVIEDGQGYQFVYDAENHQIEAKNELEATVGEYFYDGEGRRVKKIAGAETTVFVYNASGQLVAEYSTQMSSTPQISYLTTDHLGSTRLVTDQLGAVRDRKDFNAFGDETATAARVSGLGYTIDEPTRKNYTGYEKDGESGLEFAQARYYSTTHGRYTSVDPLTASASIRNPQTFNRYTYVLNSPYKYTDPLGLIPMGPGGAAGSCAQWCEHIGGWTDGSGMTSWHSGWMNGWEEAAAKAAAERAAASNPPPPPPPPAAEQNVDTLLHEVAHQFGSPPELLGDAVYEPADGRLGGGEVRSTVFPPGVPSADPFVYTTDYYASFTMRVVERETGENRTGYQYEISYDGQSPRGAAQGRQTVDTSGVIEIGNYLARSQTTGPDQPLKPFYAGDIDRTWTGTITIYASSGKKVGVSRFEASVKTVNASVGDHRVSIVETSRTVGNKTWNRPSP